MLLRKVIFEPDFPAEQKELNAGRAEQQRDTIEALRKQLKELEEEVYLCYTHFAKFLLNTSCSFGFRKFRRKKS